MADDTTPPQPAAAEKPKPSFNGEQITGARSIIESATSGQLKRDQAIAMLKHLFGFDQDAAEELIGPPIPPEQLAEELSAYDTAWNEWAARADAEDARCDFNGFQRSTADKPRIYNPPKR